VAPRICADADDERDVNGTKAKQQGRLYRAVDVFDRHPGRDIDCRSSTGASRCCFRS